MVAIKDCNSSLYLFILSFLNSIKILQSLKQSLNYIIIFLQIFSNDILIHIRKVSFDLNLQLVLAFQSTHKDNGVLSIKPSTSILYVNTRNTSHMRYLNFYEMFNLYIRTFMVLCMILIS